MRIDQIFATSGRVRTDDLDWEAAEAAGLTDAEASAVSYFADVEGETVQYLRDLLSTRLGRDPDVLAFLSIWSYEEYFHGRALATLLEACGRAPRAGTGPASRRSAGIGERLAALAKSLGSRLFPRAFPAVYVAWGATQELTTIRGYEALEASTRNPVLAELCRRIARQERRHFAWYYHSARLRLERSREARSLTRLALSRFWTPVGTGVKGPDEAARLVALLFGGAAADVAAEIDGRIGALPGLAGIRMMRAFVDRAGRAGSRALPAVGARTGRASRLALRAPSVRPGVLTRRAARPRGCRAGGEDGGSSPV